MASGVGVGEASHPGPSSRLRSRGSRVRSRFRGGDFSREARFSPDTVVLVAPATTLPALNTLPTWPDSDSHFGVGNPRGGCNAGSVPLDVLDALEEDLGVGEGEARVNAREDGIGTGLTDRSVKGQSSTSTRMTSNLLCVSEMGGLHVRFPTRIHCSGQWSLAQLWRRFQFHPRCLQSHHCPHGLMGISLPGVPEMSHLSQMAVLARSSGRPKRLRVVGHFQRISQTTTVPAPERLRDMEFDRKRGDSSSDHIAERSQSS